MSPSQFAGVIRFDRSALRRGDLQRLQRITDAPSLARPFPAGGDTFSFVSRCFRPAAAGGRVVLLDGRLDAPTACGQDAADLVLEEWQRTGDALPDRLLGDYALALWDETARALRLLSSPSPERSLYYYVGPGCVVFATELRRLLAWPDVPRVVDDIGLADTISVNLDPSDRTIWAGVRRVACGTAVTINTRGAQVSRWWDIRNAPAVRFAHDQDYVERARELFDGAVACRTATRKPLVVATSGGLDSPAVAATMCRLNPDREIYALTVLQPPGAPAFRAWRHSDERPFIAALEKQYPQLRVHRFEQTTADVAVPFAVLPSASASPDGPGMYMAIYRQAAALGADTLLTGDWGDATLSYDGLSLLPQLLGSGRWLRFGREVRALSRTGPHSALQYARTGLRQAFEPVWLRNLRHGFRAGGIGDWQNYVGVNRDFAEATAMRARLTVNSFPGGDEMARDGVRSVLAYFLARDRFSSEFHAAFRAATGVSATSPFTDRRILEFCAGLPQDQFLKDGVTRRLARRAFADRLPPPILDNRRKGDPVPHWFALMSRRRDEIIAQIEDFRRSPLASRVLDLPRLEALAKDWPADAMAAQARAKQYQDLLGRAVHVGQFLRWADPRNDVN